MRLRLRHLTASGHVGLWGCALMTVASLVAFLGDPRTAACGLLFFGSGCAFMVSVWRREAITEATAGTTGLVLHLARHDLPGYRRMVAALTPLRGSRAAAALATLAACDRALDGLFLHARRRELDGLPSAGGTPPAPGGTPLGWALASLHPDGHVRAAAVAAMCRRPRVEFAPFLVERAVDHVGAVRAAALAGLRTMLADEAAWRPVAGSYRRVAGRRHAAALAGLLGAAGGGPALEPVCCRLQGVYCGIPFGPSCDFVDQQRLRRDAPGVSRAG
ncbi:hypothetical protein BJY16_006004 [Actinoplanes octamycinicus]|uniref:HEAT repeat protein n=1 Tax=Actinoplanes octamycinicus TaxID=135948 RepID=A0A7W7MA75_9ACTN|nr:hypothetical protein [Actinoplanes octamycinicus]MBB4742545.1 hypothetical protein [Actinoplanes octamycinicus]GIE60882.1 hypothetical protein Aoc01nite_62840 [Actinoplanes octamycinicus]